MTVLADNKDRDFKEGELVLYPVVASDIIYRGALVKVNAAGYLAPCAAEAGAVFAGVAYEKKDNSSGSAGDLKCRVQVEGLFEMTGAGLSQSDVGSLVFATDDDLITLSEIAGSQVVGRIKRFVSATSVWVKLAIVSDVIGDAVDVDEVTLAEGNILLGNSSGVGAALDASGDTKMLVGNSTSITSVAMSGDVTMTNTGVTALGADVVDSAEITDNAVSLEHLDDGVLPSHVVKYAGEFTTAGGDANETISVSGALASDIVLVTLHTKGGTPVTILMASASTDQIDVVMSADPSTDHVLSYMVLRAAA